MKEELIEFSTAVLAKEKGFDWKVYDAFVNTELTEDVNTEENSKGFNYFNSQNHNERSNRTSRPSQSLLQRWFREVHNIHITLSYYPKDKAWNCTVLPWMDVKESICDTKDYPTYETALEAALQTALKLIV